MSGEDARLSRCGAVILNWRDQTATDATVASLLRFLHPEQVVVVDNQSDGQLRLSTGERGVALIEVAENRGFAGGVNTGLRVLLAAGCDYVLVLNTDTEISARRLAPLFADEVWRPATGAAGPLILAGDGRVQSAGASFRRTTFSVLDRRRPDDPRSVDFLTWACVLVSADAFSRVGLLDERFFMYWEDVEFGLRLRSAGLSCVVVDAATVVHHGSASHARAGARIDRYSAMGVAVLGRSLGGRALVGAALRLGARVTRRIFAGEWQRARETVAGARWGWRVHAPAYESLEE